MRARSTVSLAALARGGAGALGLTALALTALTPTAAADEPAPKAASLLAPWCAPELETLAHEVCAFVPPTLAKGPRTLVIFLHGVSAPGHDWQWNHQRNAMRAAGRNGFTVIAPRGRRGVGPPGMNDWWTWPTSVTAQRAVEDAILAEWAEARRTLEARAGKPFEKVLVFGFSSGGYYGASLALRDRVPSVDGYAVFAGGSGADHLKRAGEKAGRRAPLYVGWGDRDGGHPDQEGLSRVLKGLGWPSLARGHKGVGHTMTDAQVDEALAFLTPTR